jgi:hypothetical protein
MKILPGLTFFKHVYIVHILTAIAATTWSLTETVRTNKKNKLPNIFKLMPQGMSLCFLLDNYMQNGFYHTPITLILNDCV